VDGGVWTDEIGFSTVVLLVVNAAILEKTSFFVNVGEEHGLTEGVLLADIVLLLKNLMWNYFVKNFLYLIFE